MPTVRPSELTPVAAIMTARRPPARHGGVEPAQHQHHAALGAHIAVGRGVKARHRPVGDSMAAREKPMKSAARPAC